MSYTVLKNKIDEKINQLKGDNILIVLKGIPIYSVSDYIPDINLDNLVKNKLIYFMQNIFGKRNILTYEEFLLMKNIILDQYERIYILDNNIYISQYPVDEIFTLEVRNGLLNHFNNENENELDIQIGNISEYISMYYGLTEFNGYLMGSYCDDTITESLKIVKVNLFDNDVDYDVPIFTGSGRFVNIIDESDYINLIKLLFNEPDEIVVRISNYVGDSKQLKKRISLLATCWADYTDFYYDNVIALEQKFEHREEYTELLKKYWNYDSFRTLKVYDMNELESGNKKIVDISQEQIISDLVQQVENCESEYSDFKDVFVTAPTGAGKSVMFQIPAIYLAEKYNYLTIVISPLIGLMNDQVKNLELRNYKYAKTINSDISPIMKQDIIDKVAEGQYHILYISPETLLSRSDVEQLIGKRTIGMIVIDEAHIVTTWGKQFRPDYWYLGDHIRKLRRNQISNPDKSRSFVIATFTATAIYGGIEDMYTETVNSLHMLNPITYLGYVKRDDIEINIKKEQRATRNEYEIDKYYQLVDLIKRVKITNKKTLIYFPTVALIRRCWEFLVKDRKAELVTVYHGSLTKDEKLESYELFLKGEKPIMLATKAFGMGIDINDIEIVCHFAPTGNVCDYVQEIGRAARKTDLNGEALYYYNSKDFRHINRLHGLSTIKPYQLIQVIEKIYELYKDSIQSNSDYLLTKRRNAMMIDAENFTYIFNNPMSDEDNSINKVKTALLIIQKDFLNKIGFSPITVRPIPLFSFGFFKIDRDVQNDLLYKYPNCLDVIDYEKNICRVNLNDIWNKGFRNISFPQFKYLVYSQDKEFEFNQKYKMISALSVEISYAEEYEYVFDRVWNTIKTVIGKKVIDGKHVSIDELVQNFMAHQPKINKYKAKSLFEVVITSMDSYRKNFYKKVAPIVIEKISTDGKTKYQFNSAVNQYFKWLEGKFRNIIKESTNGCLYLVDVDGVLTKEYSVALGILEALDVLSFKMVGGANSQIFIYINQVQGLQNIINAPYDYENKLLEIVNERHLISVKMLTYIYENNFTSDELWNLLEDYFLGNIPEYVKRECKKVNPDIIFD